MNPSEEIKYDKGKIDEAMKLLSDVLEINKMVLKTANMLMSPSFYIRSLSDIDFEKISKENEYESK